MTNATKTTLEPFIQAAKSHGASDEFLINLLSRSGWPAEDIYELLRRHWEGTTGVAIPR